MKRDSSWLLDRTPLGMRYTREAGLWWAVIRRSAWDLRYGHDQLALDALEFLRSSGLWVSESLLGIPPEEYQKEVVDLVMRRNRGSRHPLVVAPFVDSGMDMPTGAP